MTRSDEGAGQSNGGIDEKVHVSKWRCRKSHEDLENKGNYSEWEANGDESPVVVAYQVTKMQAKRYGSSSSKIACR